MYPVVVANVATKVGPWLGRNPGMLAPLVTRLRTAGVVVGEKVTELVAWAKANPGNSAMLVTTLATLGVKVSDWLSSDDEESKALIAKLDDIASANAAQRAAVAKRLTSAAGASSVLDLDLGKDVDQAVAIQVLAFARNHYGSVAAAKAAFSLHQAFFEMSPDDIESGFNNLNLSAESVARAKGQVRA